MKPLLWIDKESEKIMFRCPNCQVLHSYAVAIRQYSWTCSDCDNHFEYNLGSFLSFLGKLKCQK